MCIILHVWLYLFQNLPVLLVVRVWGKTWHVICTYARSFRRSFRSSIDRGPRSVSYLSKSSLTDVVPVVFIFSLHKSSRLSKADSSFSSQCKTSSLTLFVSVKCTKLIITFAPLGSISKLRSDYTSDRSVRQNRHRSPVSIQKRGDTAKIIWTNFTQTWHKCWAWWVNDYGKNSMTKYFIPCKVFWHF